MNILLDACSIINLHNGDCLHRVADLPEHLFWVGPMVISECSGDCAVEIMSLIGRNKIHQIDESNIDGERYLKLLEETGLGSGEVECLIVAEDMGYAICTDDGRARAISSGRIGQENCLGSARVLRWMVECGIMTCTDARTAFETMKVEGGYLPDLETNFFCTNC